MLQAREVVGSIVVASAGANKQGMVGSPCSLIRPARGRTDMALKGQDAVAAQSWSLRGSGDRASCVFCRPSLKTCSM